MKVHFLHTTGEIICGHNSTFNPVWTKDKDKVNCKTCVAKIEFEKTGIYPEKYYKNKPRKE